MKSSVAVEALSALAHQGRLGVFRTLVKAGPGGVAAGDLARKLRMPPSTLSANLTILSNAKLVSAQRHGRSIVYSARYSAMGDLLTYLMEDCCGGRPEVCMPVMSLATACCSAAGRA